LRGLIEEFVSRDGTDYGVHERSLEEKVRDVMRPLQRGEAVIVSDPETRSANVAARLTAAVLVALIGCGGPLGPIHGGRLSGIAVATPVADWSFAADQPLMQLEVRPSDPYSVNVNGLVVDGRLYVDIGQPTDWNRWRQMIRADPRVRVRFGDRVYAARAVAVVDAAELAAIAAAYRRRHGAPPPAGATFARLDPI
jgi:uncharacterized protein YheU (UPF0270 family)